MFDLRGYQEAATSALIIDLAVYQKLGLIAPTGAGKTVMILETAKRYLDLMGYGYHVLIISHLSILQEQSMRFFKNHLPDRQVSMLGQKHSLHPLSRYVVATMQTARNPNRIEQLKKKLLHSKTALIFIDEAQLYGAASYDTISELLPEAKIIGLSASPYRKNKYSFNQFDKVSYAISLQELIDQGYLVEPRLHQIEMAGVSVESRISALIALIQRSLKDNPEHTLGKGTLVYWNTKENAELASNSFNMSGIPSAFLTDKTPKAQRIKTLEAFDKGEIRVIHNVNILSAGYDSPHVYNIMMPMGTSSPVNYIQRIGRGLRLAEGKTHCDVYCYGDSPTIKRNLYARVHRMSLRMKDDPELGKSGDILDLMEFLELQDNPKPEKVKYTQAMVKIYEHAKSINADNIANLVRFQKFPRRYLRSLITLQARKEEQRRQTVSDRQKQWLSEIGIKDTSTLSYNECEQLIQCIQKNLARRWVVKKGQHTNKTIDEIPMAYIGALIRRRQYDHPVVKMYMQWKKEGKPNTNEE